MIDTIALMMYNNIKWFIKMMYNFFKWFIKKMIKSMPIKKFDERSRK